MNRVLRSLEIAANIGIVVVAIVLSVAVGRRGLIGPANARPTRSTLRAGEEFRVPGIAWPKNKPTLSLALSASCHFCAEGAPFYRRLVSRAREVGVEVVALMPQEPSAARRYLDAQLLPVTVVHRMSATDGIAAFPTVLIVGPNGIVQDLWTGKLDQGQEDIVMARVGSLMSK